MQLTKKKFIMQSFTPKWSYFAMLDFLDSTVEEIGSTPLNESIHSEIGSEPLSESIPEIVDLSIPTSWTVEEEENLIFFYEAYPELWDPKERNYKKAKKSAVFDHLCQELNNKFSRKYQPC